ncbi:aminotransferase class I/II-fold pyridoxal phosphate-dependent enzyme [Rhizobium sp. BK176]|uniref:aminotransferase class I/II-fold pyridoxal phosphate-dependent enzyme n=1 Tax=Rhizobium sp. BK176 TaxID=2587071 RepID=UPI002169C297|nr:PLP-dependent aminotransferase family protein [Rhizobium sp. BK176]MCS4089281.1 2-aminoadipate transaminase [Rhizobium sp. BK176]
MLSLQSNTVLLPNETVDELDAAIKAIDVRRAASYADTWGEQALREDVKALTPNWTGEALITGSATQALMLAMQHVGREKAIAIQVPCYFAVLRQAKELGLSVRPWHYVDELERIGPIDAILLTSNLTPPKGISLSQEAKERIAAVARRYDAWVIEDNAYEALWFENPPSPVPADPARSIRIGSLSKIVSPDFRIGFVRSNAETLEALRSRKITMELSTPRFIQEAARAGITPQALSRWRYELKSRSDTLRSTLRDVFGVGVAAPEGGPYVALPLFDATETGTLVARCRASGLLLDENRQHYPDGRNRPYIRLHCGSIRGEDIQRAVELLSICLDEIG